MIITITVIAGLAIYGLQILLHETNKQIAKIKSELLPYAQDGGIYPKAKPVQVGELSRTIWVKDAPLYHTIKKA
jgi:hypothetical protein